MRESRQQSDARRALLIPAKALQDACRLYMKRLADDGGKAAKLIRASHRDLFVVPIEQLAAAWLVARIDLRGTPIDTAYEQADLASCVEAFKPLDNRAAHHEAWDSEVRRLAARTDALIDVLEAPPDGRPSGSGLSQLQLDIINVLASSEGNTGKQANQLALRRALAPPPTPAAQWELIVATAEAMVPAYFERGGRSGDISYKLTVEGWLQWNRMGDVRAILGAFLAAFRTQFHHTLQITTVSWKDLVAAGAVPTHHHIAATAGSTFFPFSNSTISGEASAFGRPIDIDDILSCEDVDAFIAYRRRTPFERAAFRNDRRNELTHDAQRAVDIIYRHFSRNGAWPSTRMVEVELRRAGISLPRVCETSFIRGSSVESENAKTSITLAGLGVATNAGDDRADALALLRYLGAYYQDHPSLRTVSIGTAGDALDLDEEDFRYLAALFSEGGAVLITLPEAGQPLGTGAVHLTSHQQDYVGARDFEDILFADYSRHMSRHTRWRDPTEEVFDAGGDAHAVENEVEPATTHPEARDDSDHLTAPLELIGGGTYGQVYRSLDQIGRLIAVKFIRASRQEQAGVIGHAKAIARARHGAMVQLHDVWVLVDPETQLLTPALVMEFLEGMSLEKRPAPHPLAEVREWVITLVDFLAKVHGSGTHHGDLHPGNVMITPDGLRILDPYHRDSQVGFSTRTAESWRRQDIVDAQRMVDLILLNTADADEVATAFRSFKPRLSSLEELAEAIRQAFGLR